MTDYKIVCAGFGGQGILFLGKVVAYAGLMEGKEVSWLPSYGPEMRGGTANCSVILSDDPVGSPIVTHPDCLIAMNLPSLEKYKNAVRPGGTIILDSTLIDAVIERNDVTVYAVPATKMAGDAGFSTLANMILVGKFLKEVEHCDLEGVAPVLKKVVPPKKLSLLDVNLEAIAAGYNF